MHEPFSNNKAGQYAIQHCWLQVGVQWSRRRCDSGVAPLIGSTQTGMYAAIIIWFGTTQDFCCKHILSICKSHPNVKLSVIFSVFSFFVSPVSFCCKKLIGRTERKLEILSGCRPIGEVNTYSCLYTKGDNCPVRIFDICT